MSDTDLIPRLGENIAVPSRWRSGDGSDRRSKAEIRLDEGFQRFLAQRDHQVTAWTAPLRAELWSVFSVHCRELRQAAAIPDIHGRIDIEHLSQRWPTGYLALAAELMTLLDEPKILAVGGDRGTGKTALAAGLAIKFCDSGRSAIYTTAGEFFQQLGDRPWGEKDAFRQRHATVELLVLDEVQLRDTDRAWQDNELTTLIDRRYRSGKATVLVSNLRPAALQQNLGESIWRRLIETGGEPIDVDWPRLAEWIATQTATRAAPRSPGKAGR